MRVASHLRIALMIVGTFCAVQAAEVPPLKLVQSIRLPEVSGPLDHLAVDAKGQRLFVAALGNNTLEVIDLVAGKRIKSVPSMSKPTGVLFHATANEVLVANGDNSTFKVLSGTDYSVVRTLSDLADADNLRFEPETKQAWLGYGEGTLCLIDLATAKAGAKSPPRVAPAPPSSARTWIAFTWRCPARGRKTPQSACIKPNRVAARRDRLQAPVSVNRPAPETDSPPQVLWRLTWGSQDRFQVSL